MELKTFLTVFLPNYWSSQEVFESKSKWVSENQGLIVHTVTPCRVYNQAKG